MEWFRAYEEDVRNGWPTGGPFAWPLGHPAAPPPLKELWVGAIRAIRSGRGNQVSQRDELPANAALLFDSDCQDAAVRVSVDGVPAQLQWNPYVDLTDFPGFATIDPPIRSGQQVLLQIDNAAYALEVVENDLEVPTQSDVTLVFEEFECPENPPFDCEPGEPLTLVGVQWTVERGVLRSISLSADGDFIEENRTFVIASEATTGFGSYISPDVREVCVDVRAIDASGNVDELHTCEATPELGGRGCGCTSSGEGGLGPWLLTVLVGGLRRRKDAS